ncbi:SpoVR family protein [Halococcus saccharolyticus]|uniref:Stage V sporulation protein R-like protein n=1 Tax=Halococcus saccharolyticus DSM 5350 TaxID=1227455 RepID=M0MMU6_9EURY|nr:SpoVR family protein [Halococcus saccharolyticus]EMA45780.1 stage V sporulation protein R-like protein [Halococcus saccharolyticus DSM 5350]
MSDRITSQRIARELEEPVEEAANLAKKLGLDPYPVNYWIVDHDEMNQLIAYDGFQTRYPHWRWGMKYDRQRKQTQFLGGKAFEIVNNDDPAHAFLQESNSLADQKAVITHVEAHADFFAHNQWFGLFTGGETPNAAAMLARHADTIDEYMSDPEIDREDVEKWIDTVQCLDTNIDRHQAFSSATQEESESVELDDIADQLDELDLGADVVDEVFDEEWLESQRDDDETATIPAEPEQDLLAFFWRHGMAYDDEAGKAVEMTEWQRDVLEILRREAYYFAAQRMTKVMNEGWAAYWESMMMGEETFAGADEFLNYADHQARVLGSPGLNPYKLGKELWEYIENSVNRREVIERLLRVEGITWRNFHDVIDFDAVQEHLAPDSMVNVISSDRLASLDPDDPRIDGEALERARAGEIDVGSYPWKVLTEAGMAERHYSLAKPQNRGFLRRTGREELERVSRYLFDGARYANVEEALAEVNHSAGWDRMFEIRESHNDVTFIDEFLTQEFVDDNDYFTYEYTQATRDFRATSTDYEDVKKKLLLQFTNFGKPTITVHDGNYNNRNELLLAHHYNGVMLDVEQAKQTLERVYDLWGRPVNLKTVVKEIDEHDLEVAKRREREPDPEERGKLIRYDGETFTTEDLAWEAVEEIAATDIDYDTKPDEWLA